jgi:nucleoporin NDC1
VQRDIPRSLEAFLSFLTAIETYQAELFAPIQPDAPPLSQEDRTELDKAHEALSVVRDGAFSFGTDCPVSLGLIKVGPTTALIAAINRIVVKFGNKLTAFKFPIRTARRLQVFVDHCAA